MICFICRRRVKLSFSQSPYIVPRPDLPCATRLRLLGKPPPRSTPRGGPLQPPSDVHSVPPLNATSRWRVSRCRIFAYHTFSTLASLFVPTSPFLFRTRVDSLRVSLWNADAPGISRTNSYRHEPRRAAGPSHHSVGSLAVVGETRRGQADKAEVPLLRLRQALHAAQSQGPTHARPHGRAPFCLRPLRRRLQPPRNAQGAPHHGGLPSQAAEGVRPACQRSSWEDVGAPHVNGRAQVIFVF